jgi:hypothetical protein
MSCIYIWESKSGHLRPRLYKIQNRLTSLSVIIDTKNGVSINPVVQYIIEYWDLPRPSPLQSGRTPSEQ